MSTTTFQSSQPVSLHHARWDPKHDSGRRELQRTPQRDAENTEASMQRNKSTDVRWNVVSVLTKTMLVTAGMHRGVNQD